VTFDGLPLHPLVVHAVVVLLPLGALGVLALVSVRRWRERYAGLLGLVLVLATASAFVAKLSGEALAERVGSPGKHEVWGDRLPWAALALLLLGGGWLVLERRRRSAIGPDGAHDVADRPASGSLVSMLPAVLAAVAAITVLWMTFMTGHSGATASWAGRTAATSGAAPSPSITSRDGQYTMAQVAEHATAASCWSAINGDVYDLTTWIPQHPGGANAVRSICGTDGSAGFNSRHAATKEAQEKLPEFKIGTLLR
jgi:predicted heme/steroid binding protein